MHTVKKLIASELEYFEQYFEHAFTSDTLLLDKILAYLKKRKGKQVRPIFVLLCAKLGGEINDRSYRAALFVEMLHISSLVHDDLVDDSLERRGAPSVNALWKNRMAVLTGDNLFTKSILLLLQQQDHQVLKIFSAAIGKVIEGELLQMEKARKLNKDESVYFEIIKSKTATLLAAACAAGGATTFTDEASVDLLYKFGEKAGIAFQIKDDLLDYGSADIGKPRGNDIKEQKITLPLLYTLNNCSVKERRDLVYIIKHKNTDQQYIDQLIDTVKASGGIHYAEEKMLLLKNEALQMLDRFSLPPVQAALEELVHFITERTY
ncbi:MAG: polyprenyl synthetase family protein [Ferruginibacter sp.]